MQFPSRFTAGDTLEQRVSLADYSAADGWTLTYRLIPRETTGAVVQIDCSADGADFIAAATASTTASWQAGRYSWASFVANGSGERHSVAVGQVEILPDPSTLEALADLRTPTEVALEDAKKALREWSPVRRRFKIGEREVEFNDVSEILSRISWLETELKREIAAAGGSTASVGRRRILVRLGRG